MELESDNVILDRCQVLIKMNNLTTGSRMCVPVPHETITSKPLPE